MKSDLSHIRKRKYYYVSEAEYKEIASKAKKLKKRPATLVRETAVDGHCVVAPSINAEDRILLRKMFTEMYALDNNCNQQTAEVHRGRIRDGDELLKVNKEILAVNEETRDLLVKIEGYLRVQKKEKKGVVSIDEVEELEPAPEAPPAVADTPPQEPTSTSVEETPPPPVETAPNEPAHTDGIEIRIDQVGGES